MNGHERVEELLAAEALDALDRDDADALSRLLAEHGPDCAECARLRRAYGDVAGRLAFALDPVPVRGSIADDILRLGREVPRRRPGGLRAALMAAAAAVLVAVGAVGGYLAAPRQSAEVTELARFLARPDVRVVRFEGPSGNLGAAVAPGAGFLFGSDLPSLPEGSVYELWMIRGQTPVKGLCLAPQEDVVVARFDGNLSGSDALAVTVESDSCPSRPTTEPLYQAQLQV
jgi:Anti-sigma-K factor rskA